MLCRQCDRATHVCRCAALSADEQRASEAAHLVRQAQQRPSEGEVQTAGSASAAELSRLRQFGRVPSSVPPQGASHLGKVLLGAAAAAVEGIGAGMQALGREVSEFSVYDDADRLARVLDDGFHGGLAFVADAAGTVRARLSDFPLASGTASDGLCRKWARPSQHRATANIRSARVYISLTS